MHATSITVLLRNKDEITLQSPSLGQGEALLSYFNQLFEESSDLLNFPSDHYKNKSHTHQEAFIKQFTEDKHSFAVFAYSKQQIIGHVVVHNFGYERAQHRATTMIGVLKEWQNCGLGKALLDLAIKEATSLGIVSIELRVREQNSKAINLYTKSGFSIVGRILGAAKIGDNYVNEYFLIRNDPTFLKDLSQ